MKKSKYTGWQDVFKFQFMQSIKQKSYLYLLIFMCILMLFWSPVASIIKGYNNQESKVSEVTIFTIYDTTALSIDYEKIIPTEHYKNIIIEYQSAYTYEEHLKLLEQSEKSTEILVYITFNELGYFDITYVKASNTVLSNEDAKDICNQFTEFFQEAKLKAVDVTQEQMAFLNQSINTKVEFISEIGEVINVDKNEAISMDEYSILLAGIMIVVLIISFSGSSIATSIVTEKSTKVVEYLMISIKPMALIVGKILAALLLVIIQLLSMGICYLISLVLTNLLNGEQVELITLINKESVIIKSLSGLTLINVILAFLIICMGILFFSILAGLAGASVSKMEEMAEGLKIYQFIMVIGSYIGIGIGIAGIAGANTDLFVNICSVFPISAAFVAPTNLLLGKISVSIASISLVVLVISTCLLFSFTSLVYEAMIFYNGKVLKLKDILQIAKNQKSVKKGVK